MTTQPLNLLTVCETSHLLRVTGATVRLMIADGELAAVKIRGKWMIDADQLPRPERRTMPAFSPPAPRKQRVTGELVDLAYEMAARRG